MSLNNTAKLFDVIEIVPSYYKEEHAIGNKYVVVGTLDGFDVEIINEKGEYDTVCWEDYKIIGNVNDLRENFWRSTIVYRMT